MWNPTGSCKPPLAGGGIALLSSVLMSGCCLFDELFVLRFERPPSSIVSSLSSVSALLMVGIAPLVVATSAAFDLVLGRLFDALVESADAADFFCFILATAWDAESAASSPEASRDDGWRRSAVEDCLVELCRVEVRFLFAEPDDEGDDMRNLLELYTIFSYVEGKRANDEASCEGEVEEERKFEVRRFRKYAFRHKTVIALKKINPVNPTGASLFCYTMPKSSSLHSRANPILLLHVRKIQPARVHCVVWQSPASNSWSREYVIQQQGN